METIGNFFQSIYDSYRDRIKSPFVGSFVISLLIFNWQAFAILFYSEWPLHCRIEWIEEHFYKPPNFWYPVVIALFYILILPYIHLLFDSILSIYSNKKLNKKNSARVTDLKTQKTEAKLLREIADEQAGTSEILNLQTKINLLQKEVNDLNNQHKEDSERWKERASTSYEIEQELNVQVDKLSKENRTLNSKITELNDYKSQKDEEEYQRLQDPDIIQMAERTIKKATLTERKALITLFGNGQQNKTYLPSNLEVNFLNRLIDLGLVKQDNDVIEITILGKVILALMEKDFIKDFVS